MKNWQPAFPQAMQRHGGRTRPLEPGSGKPVVTPSHDSACDEGVADEHGGKPTSAAPADTDAKE